MQFDTMSDDEIEQLFKASREEYARRYMEARAKERQQHIGKFFQRRENFYAVRAFNENGDLIGTTINSYDTKTYTIAINSDELGIPDDSWKEIPETTWREVVARAFNLIP